MTTIAEEEENDRQLEEVQTRLRKSLEDKFKKNPVVNPLQKVSVILKSDTFYAVNLLDDIQRAYQNVIEGRIKQSGSNSKQRRFLSSTTRNVSDGFSDEFGTFLKKPRAEKDHENA